MIGTNSLHRFYKDYARLSAKGLKLSWFERNNIYYITVKK